MTHKGYFGTIVQTSNEHEHYHGKVLFIKGHLVTYQAESISQLRVQFASAVDDYLETCTLLGIRPKGGG